MKVDFKMLKKQKRELVELANFLDGQDLKTETHKALEGVINLIDALQDASELNTPIIIEPF